MTEKYHRTTDRCGFLLRALTSAMAGSACVVVLLGDASASPSGNNSRCFDVDAGSAKNDSTVCLLGETNKFRNDPTALTGLLPSRQ
jgi:hypothetical protein